MLLSSFEQRRQKHTAKILKSDALDAIHYSMELTLGKISLPILKAFLQLVEVIF